MARLRTQAEWLGRSDSDAAVSLREGMEETFTIKCLGRSPMLRKCLATTNPMESISPWAAARTGRMTHWRLGEMVLRWAAAAALETERSFHKIIGSRDLCMPKATFDDERGLDEEVVSDVDKERLAA